MEIKFSLRYRAIGTSSLRSSFIFIVSYFIIIIIIIIYIILLYYYFVRKLVFHSKFKEILEKFSS